MTPDVNELDHPIIDEIVADLEGFEKSPETPVKSKWQWLLDLIKISNNRREIYEY
jgi:hypothetical protein